MLKEEICKKELDQGHFFSNSRKEVSNLRLDTLDGHLFAQKRMASELRVLQLRCGWVPRSVSLFKPKLGLVSVLTRKLLEEYFGTV